MWVFWVFPLTLSSTMLAAQQVGAPRENAVAITHVTVIDVVTGAELPDRTLLVRDHHIVTVDTTPRVRVPAGARRVDGTGRFLIPGLWDMHAHFGGDRLARTNTFPLFIANGITGARDMWGDCDSICATSARDNDRPVSAATVRRWKHDIGSGALIGPRLVAASAIFDGPSPEFPGSYAIHSPEEARNRVRLAKQHRVDFIKVLVGLSRESYLAIVDEAKRQGLSVAGHVPYEMTAVEVSNAGQRSIEHTADVDGFGSYGYRGASCSDRPDAVRDALTAARTTRDTTTAELRRLRLAYLRALTESYSESLCARLFAQFVRNDTWRVLTLVAERIADMARLGDTLPAADPRLQYVDPATHEAWLRAVPLDAHSQRTGEDSALFLAFVRIRLALPGAMQRAGVQLLAGTDEPNPWVIPGFSLHEELALLADGGLTPLEALQTATINPARFLRATDSLGVVAPGKLADLVLLDADPLMDIRNTSRIAAVIVNGRYFARPALNEMLAGAARAAGATSR